MIVGISGRKQSGKNTVANIINGEILKQRGLVDDYKINKDGQLVIKTRDANHVQGWGILDVTRKDDTFQEYADQQIWPYVKIYHFADYLKNIAINLFGIDRNLAYGTDKDKNTKTNFSWSSMPTNKRKKGNLTIREFLQYFGTELVRKIKDDAWVCSTINTINNEGSELALIPDVRFPNEVLAIKEQGGVVIRLTRDVYNDTHQCETSLDKENFDWRNFNHIIHNEDCSIETLQSEIQNFVRSIQC